MQPTRILLLLFAAIFAGCTCTQTLKIEASAPPSFRLKGNAIFDWCEVFDADGNGAAPIWRLEPDGSAIKLDELGQITYGQIPAGLVQVVPGGAQPPRLLEEHSYQFRAVIRTPNSIQLDQVFTVRDGKVEVLRGRDNYSGDCWAD